MYRQPDKERTIELEKERAEQLKKEKRVIRLNTIFNIITGFTWVLICSPLILTFYAFSMEFGISKVLLWIIGGILGLLGMYLIVRLVEVTINSYQIKRKTIQNEYKNIINSRLNN